MAALRVRDCAVRCTCNEDAEDAQGTYGDACDLIEWVVRAQAEIKTLRAALELAPESSINRIQKRRPLTGAERSAAYRERRKTPKPSRPVTADRDGGRDEKVTKRDGGNLGAPLSLLNSDSNQKEREDKSLEAGEEGKEDSSSTASGADSADSRDDASRIDRDATVAKRNENSDATQPVLALAPVPGSKPPAPRRWRRFPPSYQPTESHRRLARELGVSLEQQMVLLRDHEFKDPKSDPAAVLRTWLRRAAEHRGNRSSGKPERAAAVVAPAAMHREEDPEFLKRGANV